jgi:uncharacterized SAM-binding protein YcdF (DUF218 family)
MFVLGKAVHFLIHPWHALLFLVAVGLVLRALGRPRAGAAALWTAAGALFVVSVTPLADALSYGLETRIEPASYDIDAVSGAIVLGGGTGYGELAEARGTYVVNDSVERLTTIVSLRRARPDLPVVVTGGSGRLFAPDMREADITRVFLSELGLDPRTIEFEERSRNTHENAAYTAELLADRPGPYLLVTSAAHMPRALGAFRQAGVEVIPHPVDYRARPPSWLPNRIQPSDRMATLDSALSEIVGLVTYRLLGRTDALYPND